MLASLIYLLFGTATAHLPNLAFWQPSQGPIVQINTTGLGPVPTNSTALRTISFYGANTVSYKVVVISSGTCTDVGMASSLTSATETSLSTPYSFFPTVNATNTICAIGKGTNGRWQSTATPTSFAFVVETTPPTLAGGSMSLNGGASLTTNNYLSVAISSNDNWTGVAKLCFKYGTTTTPTTTDSCWTPVGALGASIGTSVSVSNAPTRIGFAPGSYTVYAWAQDLAGNISTLSNGGSGTLGQDMQTISYSPPSPPVLTNVVGSNTDSVSTSPTSAQTNFSASQSVVIKWKATASNGFPAGPVTLYYTTDEQNYTAIASGLPNAAGSGCTVDGTNFNGCYVWTTPGAPAGYFRVRVKVTDQNGLIALGSSSGLNTGNFLALAGNTDLGLGASAAAAMLQVVWNVDIGQQQAFVVTNNGIIYINDIQRGILKVDPANGLLTVYIRKTGAYTGEGGPATSATLNAPTKIALDNQGRLLIYEFDRILRISNSGTISTFIGQGSSTADGTLAANFQFPGVGYGYYEQARTFVPAPNGDLYFEIGTAEATPAGGLKLYRYQASDGKVYSMTFSGSNSTLGTSTDVRNLLFSNIGIRFDPNTQAPVQMVSRVVTNVNGRNPIGYTTLDPTTGVTVAPSAQIPVAFTDEWANYYFFSNNFGDLYAFSPLNNVVYKYVAASNSWTLILGGVGRGVCADNTAATSCAMDLQDFYVDATNTIYFLDGGAIRTVSNGKVLTVLGQKTSTGEGGAPLAARLPRLEAIDMSQGNKIVIDDHMGGYLWEFGRTGSLSLLAGNGSWNWPVVGQTAYGNPFTQRQWSSTNGIYVDPVTNNIYANVSDGTTCNHIGKLNRGTGKWEQITSCGPPFYSADGTTTTQPTWVSWNLIGFDGTNLLTSIEDYDFTAWNPIRAYMKTYNVSTAVQSHFAGNNGSATSETFAADGTAMSTSNGLPMVGSWSRATWDAANSRWLLGETVSSRIISVPYSGGVAGTISTFTTTAHGMNAFAYRVESGTPIIYYCGGDGNLYRRNVSAATETQLSFGSATILCTGRTLNLNTNLHVLEFIYTQNNLYGVGQYDIGP